VIVDLPGAESAALQAASAAAAAKRGATVTGKRPLSYDEGDVAGREGSADMSGRICSWVERYFGTAIDGDSHAREAKDGGSVFRPPLYFQHQGHSRTITGTLVPTGAANSGF
jgi:hypothetical protein